MQHFKLGLLENKKVGSLKKLLFTGVLTPLHIYVEMGVQGIISGNLGSDSLDTRTTVLGNIPEREREREREN